MHVLKATRKSLQLGLMKNLERRGLTCGASDFRAYVTLKCFVVFGLRALYPSTKYERCTTGLSRAGTIRAGLVILGPIECSSSLRSDAQPLHQL